MTQFSDSVGAGDISHTFGLKNMPMRSQDSVEMTVVIALAENAALLQKTIDEADSLWLEGLSEAVSQPVLRLRTHWKYFQIRFIIHYMFRGT